MANLAAALNQALNANIGPPPPDAPLPPDPAGLNPTVPNQIPPIPPPLPDSDPMNCWQWNYADVRAFRNAQRAKNKKETGKAWQENERFWKNRVGKGWKPVRVLGRGGQGIVGHWTYDGPDKDQRVMNDVCVKQAVKAGPTYRWGDGLESEARFLMLFQQANTPHIPRIYRHLYEEIGQQTDTFDYGVVHRIFLEYCPGGDLSDWLASFMNGFNPIDEYDLWCVFNCLARAALVIDHGSEDVTQQRWNILQLVHLDLKPQNVLIGAKLTDAEHRNVPPYKISDFGVAMEAPPYQDPLFQSRNCRRGTVQWLLPEQILDNNHAAITSQWPNERPWLGRVTQPFMGTASNIWQIGMIMHTLMRQPTRQEPNWGGGPPNDRTKLFCYFSSMTQRLRQGGATIGQALDVEAEKDPNVSMYSQLLRSTIAECILVNPPARITVHELVNRTNAGLYAHQMTSSGPGPKVTYPPYHEPQLSDRWYSGQKRRKPKNSAQNLQTGAGFNAAQLFAEPPPGAPPPAPRPRAARIATNSLGFVHVPPAQAFQAAQLAQAALVPLPVTNGPPPPPAPVPPIVPPVPNYPGPNPAAPNPPNPPPNSPANPPANPPAALNPLYPIPTTLTLIVHKKPRFMGLGGGNHVTIRLNNLNSNTLVSEMFDLLVQRGMKRPMLARFRLRVMEEWMRLGEFENLQNVRVQEV